MFGLARATDKEGSSQRNKLARLEGCFAGCSGAKRGGRVGGGSGSPHTDGKKWIRWVKGWEGGKREGGVEEIRAGAGTPWQILHSNRPCPSPPPTPACAFSFSVCRFVSLLPPCGVCASMVSPLSAVPSIGCWLLLGIRVNTSSPRSGRLHSLPPVVPPCTVPLDPSPLRALQLYRPLRVRVVQGKLQPTLPVRALLVPRSRWTRQKPPLPSAYPIVVRD